MILDRNGMINVIYRDCNGKIINGDFDYIPLNAIIANITQKVCYVDELGEYQDSTREYRIILGNPIYKIDDFTLNSEFDYSNKFGGKPIIVSGKIQDTPYIILPRESDKIASTREEFVNALYGVSGEFLEIIDDIDNFSRVFKIK